MNESSAESGPNIPEEVEAEARKRREANVQQRLAALEKQAILGGELAKVFIDSLGFTDLPSTLPEGVAAMSKNALMAEADESATDLDLEPSGKG